MKGIVLALIVIVTTTASSKKLVVTYLGTDFILPGGCPPPTCDHTLRDCRKEKIEMTEKFDECMAQNGKKQGCVTDLLPTGKRITIPVLANLCSKQCIRDNGVETIRECPYEGLIHQTVDPDLERRF